MQAAIVTRKLHRRFGSTSAVRELALCVPEGSIYGFLGPNGAGKTTTIRMLTGLLRPTSGVITVLGLPMPAARLQIARQVGALVETPSLYDHLTGWENLDLTRRLLGLPRNSIERALHLADLQRAGNRRVGGYSLGMRQRLALARAMLGEPRLLILDEPANGLDPDGIRDLRTMLRRLSVERGITIFVSSHQLGEVQQIATHIGLMAAGRLVAQGPLEEVLKGALGRLEIRVDRPSAARSLLLAAGHPVMEDRGLLVADTGLQADAVPDLIALLVAADFKLQEVRCSTPSLEDLYVHLTRDAGDGAPVFTLGA